MDAKTFLALTSHYRNFDDFKALEMSCAAANRYISNVNSEYSECCQVLKNSIRYFSSVVDCEVVLKLVVRARHAVYIQVIIDEELKSLAFGDTQVKPPPTVGCFGSFSFFTGSKYRVSPVEVANGKKGKPSKLSAQSTITRQGVQSITERLRVLELKLDALRRRLAQEGKTRPPLEWQRAILLKIKTAPGGRNVPFVKPSQSDLVSTVEVLTPGASADGDVVPVATASSGTKPGTPKKWSQKVGVAAPESETPLWEPADGDQKVG